MSLLKELWSLRGPLRTINIALLTELKTVNDDNPPQLMYKGQSRSPNSLIAYA
jgi:hypothetical protein